MKLVRSVFLGSAAGFAAFTGAQAADLPLAEPVEYVKICDTYGKGFFYIPGTDTCLKVGGFVRFDQRVDFGDKSTFDFSDGLQVDIGEGDFVGTPFNDGYSTRARASIRLDARTETEWGTLRSYIETRTDRETRADPNEVIGGTDDAFIENAFVQFAGFTAGRTSSFYDFVVTATIADFFSDQQVNTFAYTYSFGTGFTATVAIEDKSDRAIGALVVSDPLGIDPESLLPDQEWPNVVAALRVDQAWGAAQISAAVQDNRGDNLIGVTSFVPPFGPLIFLPADPELGWAVQAGVQINLPTANEGSYVWLQGTFSEGATAYGFLGDSLDIDTGKEDFSRFGGERSKEWAVGGGFNWQATTSVALYGSAAFVHYEASDRTRSPNSETIQAAAGVLWVPVENLNLYLEGQFVSVDFSDEPGFAERFGTELDDFRLFSRIQRNF